MVAAVAAALCWTGCKKEIEEEPDGDAETDAAGDWMPDLAEDTAVDVPGDTAEDTADDTVEDVAGDVPVEPAEDGTGDATTTCVCGDPGVTLEPDDGCSTWPDATECTGWTSVIDPDHDGEPAVTDPFEDGSEFCAYGCCITIVCP
jgi:hypothetical protein